MKQNVNKARQTDNIRKMERYCTNERTYINNRKKLNWVTPNKFPGSVTLHRHSISPRSPVSSLISSLSSSILCKHRPFPVITSCETVPSTVVSLASICFVKQNSHIRIKLGTWEHESFCNRSPLIIRPGKSDIFILFFSFLFLIWVNVKNQNVL